MIKESNTLVAVNPIIKTIKSCTETLMLSPKGIANIPITHNRASKRAFLVILLTERIIVLLFISVIQNNGFDIVNDRGITSVFSNSKRDISNWEIF